MVEFNVVRFDKLFGKFSLEMQEMAYDVVRNLSIKSIFGLSDHETFIFRKYLSDVNGKPCILNCDELEIINSDDFYSKLFYGVISDKYRIELLEVERSIRTSIDFSNKNKLDLIKKYTVTQLMDMFGLGAYPLIKHCKELGIFPLEDDNCSDDRIIRCISFSPSTDTLSEREEFLLFRRECELRQLINTSNKETLSFVSMYTVSELKDMFGEVYDVLEMYCRREGISSFVDLTGDSNVVKVKSRLED